MASCFRCDVGGAIRRRGNGRAEILEVIRPPADDSPNGWTQYEIWVPLVQTKSSLTPGDPRLLIVDGLAYQWVMTGFSQNHSHDKDCWHPDRNKPGCGFPDRRLPAAGLVIQRITEQERV